MHTHFYRLLKGVGLLSLAFALAWVFGTILFNTYSLVDRHAGQAGGYAILFLLGVFFSYVIGWGVEEHAGRSEPKPVEATLGWPPWYIIKDNPEGTAAPPEPVNETMYPADTAVQHGVIKPKKARNAQRKPRKASKIRPR